MGPTEEQATEWAERGFLQWRGMLDGDEVAQLRAVYDAVLAGEYVESKAHRYDLGAGAVRVSDAVENIVQVMWPSSFVPALHEHPMRQRALEFVAKLHGDPASEWAFDFDMMISKHAHTNTPTPPHQDQAYWIDLP